MTNIVTDEKIIDDFLNRRIDQVIPGKKELRIKLLSGQKIKLYLGIDPTSPMLHIGHLVGILVLKQFQDLGHEVILLMGDFTATIGDPSGKDKTRQPLTLDQVQQNMTTYTDQIKNLLNFENGNPVQIQQNSSWLKDMKFDEVLELAMNFTAQQMIERDMFQKRINEGKPISLHEFLYPVMVTKDALAMRVDLEVGGSDQLFNMSVGRSLIKNLTGVDKFAVTFPLLTDSNGNKIGKTEGNAINIANPPEDLYGQIMSLPDGAIVPCFKLITQVPSGELPEIEKATATNPMQQKKRLAWELVKMLNSKEEAREAQEHFEKTVQAGHNPDQIPEFNLEQIPSLLKRAGLPADRQAHQQPGDLKAYLTDLIVGLQLTPSKSEAKRLIEQNAVKIDDQVVNNPKQEIEVKSGMIIKAGKRKFVKIV